MDVICKRFPLVNKMVLKNLDNQSLARIKEASQRQAEFLKNQRFNWIRVIKKYNRNFEAFEESWREVINKIPFDVLEQLAVAILKFFKSDVDMLVQRPPILIAAENGSIDLCRYILTKAKDKNPVLNKQQNYPSRLIDDKQGINNKITLFHITADNGNIELCNMIMDNLDNKNPKNSCGCTPLHFAAAPFRTL